MSTAKNTMFLILPPHLPREKAVFVGRGMGISTSASTASSEGDLQMRKAEQPGGGIKRVNISGSHALLMG